MKTLKFKTTINCGGCIASVTPGMNALHGIEKWSVDISDPNKILTVETDSLTEEAIIENLKSKGFKAERIGQ